MAEFIKAASITDVPPGTMRTITIQGKKIALANVDQQFFAIDDICSHEECSLGTEGFIDYNVVICGCHGAQFDVTTGDVLSLPATQPVKSYITKIVGDEIFVEL